MRNSPRPMRRIWGIRPAFWALAAISVLVLAGCAGAQAASPQGAKSASQAFTAKLAFNPARTTIGTTVAFSGSGYPHGSSVDLIWHTVKGSYQLTNKTEYVGQHTDETTTVLATTQADQAGNISGTFVTPADYGGEHDVRGRVAGKEMSQAGLTIAPTFSMTPSSGPLGTLVELKIAGVDWRPNINTWHVLYDNHYFGFMSAVTTQGLAIARFRAAGPVGKHTISVWHNSVNPIPYLNYKQGPFKDVPDTEFVFALTSDPGASAPAVENFTAADNPWPVKSQGSGKLTLSVDRGTVGQQTTLQGSNLPVNAQLTLRWWTMVGNRVSAIGFSEQSNDIANVQTDAHGAFSQAFTFPADLGGQHRLEVVQGDTVLAATGLVIEPSVVSVTPVKVQAGDKVQIHLKGVGWTTYDNTYGVTYDDSYIGYVCGFSTAGNVLFTITATGAPGTHIIDLYPTIYKGKNVLPWDYSIPQLTYATDHPQRITPAIRLSIQIVP